MPIDIQTVLCGEIQENAYIVSLPGRGDCAVVDPGDDYPDLKKALGGLRVAAILLTHCHFDHIMAVAEMAAEYGAPAYIHPDDMEMLNDPALNGREGLMGQAGLGGPPIRAEALGETVSAAGLDFTEIGRAHV